MDDLFAELKLDVDALANPLIAASESFVRKRRAFLPHGAVLEADGTVRMVMAGPEGDFDAPVSAVEIMPRLHDALCMLAQKHEVAAVGVCEDVTITLAGEKQTNAIKVLVEHRRGLTVALYLPWQRKLLGGFVFGSAFALAAESEVRPWNDGVSA